jgi:DNA-binding CsgD family transcriptional regulator
MPGRNTVPGEAEADEAPHAGVLLGALTELYRYALESDPWTSIMAGLTPLFGADKAIFGRIDRTYPRHSVIRSFGVERETAVAFVGRNVEDAPELWRAMLALSGGSVFCASELVAKQVLRPAPPRQSSSVLPGVEHVLGAVLENTMQFYSHLAFMRAGSDFDDGDRKMLAALLPHLRSILQINQSITLGDAARREALLRFERARQPVVVLDRSGYALYANQAAQRVLAQTDGVELRFGRFIFQDVATQVEFERLVRTAMLDAQEATAPAAGRIRVPRRGVGSPYMISVVPVSRPGDRAVLPEGAGCLVLIHDLDVSDPLPLDGLAWLYRLTPAEARVCDVLFRSASIDRTAGELGLTRNTVRSHLKSIYSKLGITTQGQLMQRLANSTRLTNGAETGEAGN